MEIIEETEKAILHFLHIRNISQKGVLDDGSRLALVLIRFTTQTQLVSVFVSDCPGGQKRRKKRRAASQEAMFVAG